MESIVKEASRSGIVLFVEDGGLRFQVKKGSVFSPELKQKIVANKAAIIAFLEQYASQSQDQSRGPVTVADSQQRQVMSFAQQRLWFIDQLDGQSAQYNMPALFSVTGDFSVTTAEQALHQVISRHEVLRTVYIAQGDSAIQQVTAQFTFAMDQYDLTTLPADEREAQLQTLMNADVHKGFDLTKDLMVRASYTRLEAGSQASGVLAFNMHHIATDGWSMDVLAQEFAVQYRAIVEGQANPLPELSIQYADYGHWQRQWLQGEALTQQLDYWLKQLEDLPPVHSLALDLPRPTVKQVDGARLTARLPATVASQLQAVAKHHELTPFMLIHSALALVLARHSNSHDIVIGTPVANRLEPELASLIGFFVNTLVLRVDTDHQLLADYFKHVCQVHLDGQSHQDVPFEQLVERLNIARNTALTPLFQIMLTTNSDYGVADDKSGQSGQSGKSSLTLPGIEMTLMDHQQVSAKFDLDINITLNDQGVDLGWIYDTSIFSAPHIEQLNEHLCTVLAGLADSQQPLPQGEALKMVDLPMLSAQESRQLVVDYHHNQLDYNASQLIHHLFEAQALQTPDAIALVYLYPEQQPALQLSYRELNEQANQLAHHLLARGIESGDLVGISLSRTPLMVVAVLAVLKANGAYVPLDPNYPQSRLQYLLDDSGIKLMLTDQDWAPILQVDQILRIDEVDSFSAFAQTNPVVNGSVIPTPEQLAYVIYTSGSTGQPKGVAIEHRNTVAMLHWAKATYSDTQLARVLASTSLNFDLSIFELFVPLCFGYQCVLVKDALTLLEQDVNVTLINTVPSAISALMAHDAIGSGVKVINLAGEPLSAQVVNTLLQSGACDTVFNLYGPSEDTTYSTYAEFSQPVQGVPPIGRVIANSQAYVLSDQQALLPHGSIGELCLAGDGVARGYLNRPELTSEKFVDNPFGPGKLYRTGDMVRYLTPVDGTVPNLDFIGRADEQVKLRGFRIELGEIENQLEQLSIVDSAVVLVKQDPSGQQQLVAYVEFLPSLLPGADEPTLSSIIEPLALTLPHYMVPGALVIVQKWPLTPNGKIDKKALLAREAALLQSEYVAPQGDMEQQLTLIWADILGLKANDISAQANFFMLGGHSLLSVRLAAAIASQLTIEVTIKTIFAHPTIVTLAATLDELGDCAARPAIVPLDRDTPIDERGLVTSFAQQRLWLLDQIDGSSVQYNMPAALKLSGRLNMAALNGAFTALIERHETLRTVFAANPVDGEPMQVIRPAKSAITSVTMPVIVPVTDLSMLATDEQSERLAQVATEHGVYPFDLSSDLMLQLKLITLNSSDKNSEHVLLFNMHHIASDGWSMAILINEFCALYDALDQDLDNPLLSILAPLPIQYVDYAQWQRDTLQGEVLQGHLDYWTQQLADLPTLHSLPLAGPRPPVQSFNGASHLSQLDNQLTEQLNTVCRFTGATLFMGLHAAFSVLLARYSNETDIVIGSPVANREQAEVAGLIGFFVNTLVLRSDLSSDGKGTAVSFIDLLKQSKQTLLDAYEHQQLPFEQLVEALQPQRNLSHSPLFQVMLVLQNNEVGTLTLPDLTLTPLDSEATVAKFDLTLRVGENAQGLALEWQYNSDLFAAEYIATMAGHFEQLVTGLLSDAMSDAPPQSVFALPMLGEDELHRQLVQWQGPKVDYPTSQCVHQLFERQAGQTPDAIAVLSQGREQDQEQLTYAQLNRRANRLATYLTKHRQVGVGSLVGICVERSVELMVGLLGVLKAGAAYVPLNPTLPSTRLAYIIADAGLTTVLSQSHLGKLLPDDEDKLLFLESMGEEIVDDAFGSFEVEDSFVAPNLNLDLNSLAYVIYTSGTTGQPKGVELQHSSLLDYCSFGQRRYYQAHLNGSLVVTSFAFDMTVPSLYLPLLCGDTVELAADDELSAMASRLATSDQHYLLRMTPMHVSALLTLLESDFISQAAHVFVIGGDVFKRDLATSLQRVFPRAQVLNHYGPTEATVGCTVFDVSAFLKGDGKGNSLKDGAGALSIGQPMDNTCVVVLGQNNQLLPPGAVGELAVGGACLARGYLNQPELSAEKFIVNPFYDMADGALLANAPRLYKTGDLVRWLAHADGDGQGGPAQLEYVGRCDDQVKIRGFRIELGEIEYQLNSHDAVASCLVLAKQSQTGEPQLVAYVVAKADGSLPDADLVALLRQYLQGQLPDYMVPAAFVVIDEIPLTVNGKVDKKALPDVENSLLQGAYVAASTDTEQQLVALWAQVLKRPDNTLSVTANFFELGGHSLLAVRLVAAIANQLDAQITVKAIFANPTIVTLAATLDGSDRQVTRSAVRPAIVPLDRDSVGERGLVTSFAQQRLWVLTQMEGAGAHYNMPAALKLSGRLNMAALNDAFSALIERHETLRTVFAANSVDDEPMQIIRPFSPALCTQLVPVTDLSMLSSNEQADRLAQVATEHAAYPFDLASDLMLQLQLIKLKDSEYVLLFNMHHIASDGWSKGILINEFCALYDAFDQGLDNPLLSALAPLPIQYADYAQWQRDTLQGEVLQGHLDYWTEQLADLPTLHSLPLDKPRPAIQTFKGASHHSQLDADLTGQLNAMCRSAGATLFMGLHAAFSVLLARYSNETDIVIGTPVANREQFEVAGLIGFFVNNLVLRSDLSTDEKGEKLGFEQLLGRTKQTLLDAYEHQQLPFEQLVEALQPQRNLSHSPLFQVVLVLQNNEAGTLALPDLTLTPLEGNSTVAKYDLTLAVSEGAQGLALEWQYNSDLFSAVMIANMAAHFARLVKGLLSAAAPGVAQQSVFEVPMLGDDEWQQLLLKGQGLKEESPTDLCIGQLFEQQVERTPEAVAVVYEQQSLSYDQLNRRANQLAHTLVEQHQVTSDTLVGICVDRSLEMLVGILAVLKAGGAYVPLDPAYPQSRLDYILDDANIAVVLVQQQVLNHVDLADCQTIIIDSNSAATSPVTPPVTNPKIITNSQSLAYVIYTSGSTGQPKGVMVTHQNVRRLFTAAAADFSFSSEDVWTLFHSFSFDFSVWEIWGALLHGGRLVVVPQEIARSTDDFYQLVKKEQVTVLNQTPSAFNLFIGADRQMSQTSQKDTTDLALRYVIFGGEALDLAALSPWVEKHGDAAPQLINMYGITETTVHVTYRRITTQDINQSGHLSLIGRPLADLAVTVLSPTLTPVPVGVPGELHISGAGLARGYLNREVLTVERFIASPFAATFATTQSQEAARLYKSGDLVRWLADADGGPTQLEYLGRIDQQVKIRGFRIELGEIEHQLQRHNDVDDVVVVSKDEQGLETYLVAYIATAKASALNDFERLRQNLIEHLSEHLPAYMVPSIFVFLDKLPLTNNGKVDRKALPDVDDSLLQGVYVAPSTETEQQLVALWAQVLKCAGDTLSVTANFFELGGHSLLAVRLVANIASQLDVEVSVKAIFANPTIVTLAAALDEQDHCAARAAIVRLDRDTVGERGLVTSFAQQRLWVLDQIEGASVHYNMPAALKLSGRLNMAALNGAFTALIERHESLRTVFAANPVDGEPMQVIRPISPALFAELVPVTDLSMLSTQDQTDRLAQVVAEHGAYVFDLASDLMLQLKLITLGSASAKGGDSDSEHVLLFNMHHIASDGWSMGILVNEFCALYGALDQSIDQAQEKPLSSVLGPLPIQYADYAQWQRDTLQGEVLQGHLDYWRSQLADLPTQHNLPLAGPRPAVQTFNGVTHASELDRHLTGQLNALCQGAGASLFMGLHAAFAVLLARYSNETDIVIGTPVANREQAEVAGLIGFFINTLVLRSDLSGKGLGFIELLNQSKQTLLDAYEHQQLPFEQLVETLQPQRSPSHSPLFQVMLVLQNNEIGTLELPDLTLSPYAQSSTIAKYDLSLNVIETAQGLSLGWEYNSDLFTASMINKMAEHFGRLISGLVTDSLSVFEVPMLGDDELHQQLVQWQGDKIDYPTSQCLHQLFEQQVVQTPDAVAVVFVDDNGHSHRLSYRQLNEKANQLAHYLIADGRQERQVKPDILVGVCVDRSLEMLIGIMGILKAGGAYVPLDPDYPPERLEYMLKDAQGTGPGDSGGTSGGNSGGGLTMVLTQQHLRASLGLATGADTRLPGIEAVCLDDPQLLATLAAFPVSEPVSEAQHSVSPAHLAYMIYTSGSTGQPKGVMVEHRQIVMHLERQRHHLAVNADDVFILAANIIFDASIEQLILPLLYGASVVIPADVREVGAVKQMLLDHQVTQLHATPGYLEVLGDLPQGHSVRLIMSGGDVMSNILRQRFGQLLLNSYGPTEATITCLQQFTDDTSRPLSTLDEPLNTIGKPLANTCAYVLNQAMQLVPQGVAGELHIGGGGLTRGYLNQPALTAERFIDNPFEHDKSVDHSSAPAQGSLYKTGDLVKWQANGSIEFIGRIDHQVKIRGFRIELGEIEVQLAAHDAVSSCLVLAPQSQSGGRQLVAYVIPTVQPSLPEAELVALLRQHLQLKLADYMVPAAFVVMDEMPLTANGKLDRKALPAPDLLSTQAQYIAPVTDTERQLVSIWSTLLQLPAEQLSTTVSFFDVGGHSLLLVRLANEIKAAWPIQTDIRAIFAVDTIDKLAAFIDDEVKLLSTFASVVETGSEENSEENSEDDEQTWEF